LATVPVRSRFTAGITGDGRLPMSASSSTDTNDVKDRAALVAASDELIPMLRKQAAETERLGRLAPATMDALRASGLTQVLKPARFGGQQADLKTLVDVLINLGTGDVSVAWVAAILNANDYFLTDNFAHETIEEVYADPLASIASVVSTRNLKAKWVDDGVLVEEGVWNFNSGVYHARWDNLAAPLLDPKTGVMEQRTLLVPTSKLEILDDWNVSGMRGTGSTSVRLKNTFVPRAHINLTKAEKETRNEKFGVNWLSRVNALTLGPLMMAAPVLGGGQGALDLFLEKAPTRNILYTKYQQQSEAAVTHVQVAEASAKIDAAKILLRKGAADAENVARAGRPATLNDMATARRDIAFAVKMVCEAVDLLAAASGGSFIMSTNAQNRVWRDVRAAAQHAVLTVSTNYEAYGRIAFGLDPENATFQAQWV
jgi:3-hydroxy-9,10-secoandrosta-1,3,5(10)-triene-9,17-dione monooxygenase